MTPHQRYLIYFAYTGTRFRGSQIQNSGGIANIQLTVQGSLEDAFKYIFKLEGFRPIQIKVTSRTDAGVHAVENGAHVDLPPLKKTFLTPEVIQSKVNHYLAKKKLEIRLREVLKVPDSFDAVKSVVEKTYLYRIGILKDEFTKDYKFKKLIPTFEFNRTHFLQLRDFDFEKAKKVTQFFVGSKDFGAVFSKPSKYKYSTVCDVKSFDIEKAYPFMPDFEPLSEYFTYFHLTCRGNRFLYHMVRRMVGIVMSAASNIITEDNVLNLFENPIPSSWNGKTMIVPSEGLYLLKILYNPEHLVFTEEEKNEEIRKNEMIGDTQTKEALKGASQS